MVSVAEKYVTNIFLLLSLIVWAVFCFVHTDSDSSMVNVATFLVPRFYFSPFAGYNI